MSTMTLSRSKLRLCLVVSVCFGCGEPNSEQTDARVSGSKSVDAATESENFDLGVIVNEYRDTYYFNESWYLQTYPDVANAVARGVFGRGYDHYVLNGKTEGRYASLCFNETQYRNRYPDVDRESSLQLVGI